MSKTFNMVGGGTNVIANPAMTGTEIDLQGLEVSGTKYKVPLIRPNLLDNWYFVGGGSQQGGGQLPINQRGQTSYSGAVGGIDRWKGHQNQVTATLNSDGLSISRSAGDFYALTQYIENVSDLIGKKVTISFLYSGDTVSPYRVRARLVANGNIVVATTDDSGGGYQAGLIWGSGVVPADTTSLFASIYTSTTAVCKAYAIKLELGGTQTLAHNEGTEENPVWVLNGIPNYTEELWKCQRYYQLFASSSYRPTYGENYRPPMRLHSPTKGTISIGGTTYYYADANL